MALVGALMDPQLKAQLAETINVSTQASVDAAGDPAYNAPAARSARVVNKRDTIERADGTILKTEVGRQGVAAGRELRRRNAGSCASLQRASDHRARCD